MRSSGKRVRSRVFQPPDGQGGGGRVRKGQSLCRRQALLGSPPMPQFVSRERIAALLAAAPQRRVAVVGDAMLDVYLHGDVDRISPEAPVPVVRVRERRHALGGAGNVAQNVRAVGATCDLVAT